MFTGLIQALGTIRSQTQDQFLISPQSWEGEIWADLAIGDSVAVDGVCLTVTAILASGFMATLSPETRRRSTLERRSEEGGLVNLETSLRVGSKLGGHFVTGHVDGIASLWDVVATDNSWLITFGAVTLAQEDWQRSISRFLITKGSIAVNGISLTIASFDPAGSWFKVAVIPHTYTQTNLCYLQPGQWVNLETDILGKYVEKLLRPGLAKDQEEEDISLLFLAEQGYV